MNRRLNTVTVLGSALALLLAVGCSGAKSQPDAGPTGMDQDTGTQMTDDAGVDAGDDAGVDAGPSCDAGSSYDSDAGTCVADNPCGDGYHLDEATGECLQDPPPPPPTPLVDTPDGGSDGGPTGPGFETQYISAYCDYLIRCQLDVHDKSLCVAEQLQRANEFNDIGERVSLATSGKATYDAEKASLCIADIKATKCGPEPVRKFVTPNCRAVFAGTQGVDYVCTSDADCQSGLFCLLPQIPDPTGSCVGSCQPVHDRCQTDDDCPDGEICNDNAQHCEVPALPAGTLNQRCGTHNLCAKDETNIITGDPLYLGCFTKTDPNTNTTKSTCQELFESGPCDDLGECAPGSVCVTDATGSTCHPHKPAKTGEPCNLSDQNGCADPNDACVPMSTMEASGYCMHVKQLGESCTTLFECGGTLSKNYCDLSGGTTGTCVARPSSGPCPVGDPRTCDPLQAYCDMTYQPSGPNGDVVPTCFPFKSEGATCSDDVECGPWYQTPSCRQLDLSSSAKSCVTLGPPVCN